MLTNAILADEYAQSKSDSFTYSDEDLETYYEENACLSGLLRIPVLLHLC